MAYCTLKSYKLKLKPLDIFTVLGRQRNCFFLDSSLDTNALGRYSFLGIEPFYILQTKGEDPFPILKKITDQYKISVRKNKIPFLAGAVGYLSYDTGLLLEKKIKIKPKEELGIPDCSFGFYNTIVIVDHLKRFLHIFSTGFPEKKYHLAKSLSEQNFKRIYKLICQVQTPRYGGGRIKLCGREQKLTSNFDKKEYLAAIKKAKEYIRRGDIYQVNLSQQFMAKSRLSGFEIYRRLRKVSPTCFSAYLDGGNFQVLSSSPERFLSLEDDLVVTRPMKGTRPRHMDPLKDALLRRQLLKSGKDKAELTMIVDLERNDLGRVCSYDSVKVAKIRQLEKYSTVFQTTATIEGRLHKNKDRTDLLRACFPGGSITGCPKIRAMEIIEELEPGRRSIYTGILGYLSFSGNMDFNILIRTILKKENRLYFGVGGGIVADSRPEAEYEETLVKARAMLAAISCRFEDVPAGSLDALF